MQENGMELKNVYDSSNLSDGAMDCWIVGSILRHFHWAISRSSQCSTTGVTKAVVCAILSVGWCISNIPANRKE